MENRIYKSSEIYDSIITRGDFEDFIPQLTSEEFEQLELNILKDGVRDPLVFWAEGTLFTLLDGHNRLAICLKHDLEFPCVIMEFDNEDIVKLWMVENQMGKRNISGLKLDYLRGLKYNRMKSQGKRTDLTYDQSDLKLNNGSTASALGKEYNVGEVTIRRCGELAAHLETIGDFDKELKKAIINGTKKFSRKEIEKLAKVGNQELHNGSKNQGPKVISAKKLAWIAFQYITNEKRPIEEVMNSLTADPSNLTAFDFFTLWASSMRLNDGTNPLQ